MQGFPANSEIDIPFSQFSMPKVKWENKSVEKKNNREFE